jgi:hypothetical protein
MSYRFRWRPRYDEHFPCHQTLPYGLGERGAN